MFKTVIWIPIFMIAITSAENIFGFDNFKPIEQDNPLWNKTSSGPEICYTCKENFPKVCWIFNNITFNCSTKGYPEATIKIFIGDSEQYNITSVQNDPSDGDQKAILDITKLRMNVTNDVFICEVQNDDKISSLNAMKLQDDGYPETPTLSKTDNIKNGYYLICNVTNARFDSQLEIGLNAKSQNTTRSKDKYSRKLQTEYRLEFPEQLKDVYCKHTYSISAKVQMAAIPLSWTRKGRDLSEDTATNPSTKPKDQESSTEDKKISSTVKSTGGKLPASDEPAGYIVVGVAVAVGVTVILVVTITWMYLRQRHNRKNRRMRRFFKSEEVLQPGPENEYACVIPKSQRRPPPSEVELNYSEPYDHVPDQPYMDIGSELYASICGSEHYAEPNRDPRYVNEEPFGDTDSSLYAVPCSSTAEYANTDAMKQINKQSNQNQTDPVYSVIRPKVAPKPRPNHGGTSGYVAMQ